MKLRRKLGLTCALALGTVAAAATIGFTTVSCSATGPTYNPSADIEKQFSREVFDTMQNKIPDLQNSLVKSLEGKGYKDVSVLVSIQLEGNDLTYMQSETYVETLASEGASASRAASEDKKEPDTKTHTDDTTVVYTLKKDSTGTFPVSVTKSNYWISTVIDEKTNKPMTSGEAKPETTKYVETLDDLKTNLGNLYNGTPAALPTTPAPEQKPGEQGQDQGNKPGEGKPENGVTPPTGNDEGNSQQDGNGSQGQDDASKPNGDGSVTPPPPAGDKDPQNGGSSSEQQPGGSGDSSSSGSDGSAGHTEEPQSDAHDQAENAR